MKIRKSTLYRVPLFCILSGIIAYHAAIFFMTHFAVVKLPDGTVSIDDTRVFIIYSALFAATLFIGGRIFFRSMTRKEIFLSASIIVALGLFIDFIQWAFHLTSGPGAVFFMYTSQIFEWSSIVPQLLYKLTHNPWLGSILGSLTPYLFLLFGKKE